MSIYNPPTPSSIGAVPVSRQVIAGTNMTGGGNLNADVTLNSTGGGGSSLTFGQNNTNTTNSSATASRGGILRPAYDVTFHALFSTVSEIAGGTYVPYILEFNSSYVVTSILGSGPTFTSPASGNFARIYPLTTPVICAAGGTYGLIVTRTDIAGSSNGGVYSGTGEIAGIPTWNASPALYARFATNAPAIGQTWETGSNPYSYGGIFELTL